MSSEWGYDESTLWRRVFSAGSRDVADSSRAVRDRAARWSRREWTERLRLWLNAVLAMLPVAAAMAGPSKPESADGSTSDRGSAAPSVRGAAGPEPPPEMPKPDPPEGVAVQRYGNADLLELLGDEPVTSVLQPGEILFKEGDPGTTMYLVRSGVLRIRSGSVVYEDVAAGGIVGEMGLVEKHMPRSATIYALQLAELVEIDEDRFERLVERHPHFAVTVMRVLSRRLRHMDRRYRTDGS